MVINNSLNVQERIHLPPSSLSLAGQTLAREARNYRDYLPAFLPFPPSLSFSPFTHFTHLQADRLATEMDSQAQQQPPCRVPRLLKRRGVWAPDRLRVYEQHSESSTTRGAPVSDGLPKEAKSIGDPRKTTETETRTSWETVDACKFPGSKFPAKFGCQPIKLELYPQAHTYTAYYVRVHFRPLGVYKESRVAYRAIRVRVS